ncbi:MAG: hypothetical protein RLZZ618_770 [Pseudomonadota bacterium]|jgi:hypothetical protein
MMRITRALFLLVVISFSMSATASEFFPPDYKQFPFKEGDLLTSQSSNGKYAVNKILKIDKVVIKQGQSINIQGKSFVAPIEDHLLVVSTSYGAAEFQTIGEARAAAKAGRWKIEVGHVPTRAPGAAQGQTHLGHAPVTEAELSGYRLWKAAFDGGKAGVF